MPNVANRNLHTARNNRNDEFYTQLSDIERELMNYKEHFKGKVVFCNCDDPRVSNFFHYFSYNFEKLGLKKLISTCYKNQDSDLFSQNTSEKAVYLVYEGDKNGNNIPDPHEIGVKELKGDGDFRSEECIELLKEADIVVTNPPFSLFREYVAQLIEYEKKFLIIGNKNSITYKEIFKLIKENKLWIGCRNINKDMWFILPKNAEKWEKEENGVKLQHIMGVWFTNLDVEKRHEHLILYKTYENNETYYPIYDNYDAININKVVDIPMDYRGVMGVPITFIDKYNPEQFEILGMSASAGYDKEIVGIPFLGNKDARPLIAKKNTYARIFIKNKTV